MSEEEKKTDQATDESTTPAENKKADDAGDDKSTDAKKEDAPAKEKADAKTEPETKEEAETEEDTTTETKEVPEQFKGIIEAIEKMTVLEAFELKKVIEDHFGVVAAAAAAPGGGDGGEAEAEQTDFTIELAEVGGQKIAVIKVVKEVCALGLKEAKDLVDGAPAELKSGVKKEEAEEIKAKLEEAGASVNLK